MDGNIGVESLGGVDRWWNFPSIAYGAIVISFSQALRDGCGNFPSIAYGAIVISFSEALRDG